ncbi:hypothetical protein QYL93_16580 [Acidovorax sp. A1169]|nr:hypothetical protein [Acidovorax sp. A1169]
MTRKPSPVPARLRILSAWVAAIEQQSRVWLPLSLGGASLADLTVFVPLCGMSVLVFVATVIMVLDWRAQYLWSISGLLGCLALLAQPSLCDFDSKTTSRGAGYWIFEAAHLRLWA